MALLALALLLQPCTGISVHFQAEPDCRDPAPDEHCHRSVTWLLKDGLRKHPNWYPELSSQSSFQEVQVVLFKAGKSNCPKPCPAADREEACHDAEQGEECFRALSWVKSGGLQKHPDWYPGLTAESTVEDIQAELHRRGKAGCLRPCPPAEPGCDKSGLCRRKMPVEAMNLDQLNRFLTGEWDGYTMASSEQEKSWEALRARAMASTSTAPAAPAAAQAAQDAEAPAGNVARPALQESQANLAKVLEEEEAWQGSDEPLPEIDQDAEEVKLMGAPQAEAQAEESAKDSDPAAEAAEGANDADQAAESSQRSPAAEDLEAATPA